MKSSFLKERTKELLSMKFRGASRLFSNRIKVFLLLFLQKKKSFIGVCA